MLVRRKNPARQMTLDRWMRPARGRVDRDLRQQSLVPRSSKRLGDRSNRHEERGHPPFLRQPAVGVALHVVAPRPLPCRRGPLAAGAGDRLATHGVHLSPPDPAHHGIVEACVVDLALAALGLAPPLSRARGSERDSAAAAAPHDGHLNAAHGSRSAAEPLPQLEPANAVNGRAVGGGGQQRHPNSRSSEEEEDEEEEEIEWQVEEEVDQEETEEKQEQEEEQHEGLDDGDH